MVKRHNINKLMVVAKIIRNNNLLYRAQRLFTLSSVPFDTVVCIDAYSTAIFSTLGIHVIQGLLKIYFFISRGRYVASGADLCDCLNEKCAGCWFECIKCESSKCGTECRVFRKYVVDSIEYHGYDKTIRNPLLLKN